jgi:hypothetical protein
MLDFCKDPRRARRRADRERMIRHALEIARRSIVLPSYSDFPGDPKEALFRDRETFARNHDNLAACSCWMCGNPRRHYGAGTRQEAAQQEAERLLLRSDGHRVRGRRWRCGW